MVASNHQTFVYVGLAGEGDILAKEASFGVLTAKMIGLIYPKVFLISHKYVP